MASLKQKFEEAAVKLAQARSALAHAQAEWDNLYKQIISGARQQRKTDSPAGATFEPAAEQFIQESIGRNTTNQILDVLKSDPAKEWDYDQISAKVPGTPRASIRVILYGLKKDKKVIKPGRGKWKAA